ncbi:MAG: efflux RND transporter permease subunit [Arenimonas sp.]
MKTMAELSLRRPVTAVMFYISMVVIGLIAAFRLPLEQFPDISFPFVFVQMPYANSTPSEVERTVTRPAEEAISTVDGIKRIDSNSRSDGADIFLQFSDMSRDIGVATTQIRDRLDAIRRDLPSDFQRYQVLSFSPSGQAMLQIRFAAPRDLSGDYELIRQHIARRLERVPGVARVDISGATQPEVEIAIDSARMTAHNISLNELAAKLRAVNFSASGGEIDEGQRRLRVQPVGEIRSLDQMRNLVIDANGLRLSDIADIRLKPQRTQIMRRLDGTPAVGIDVFRESDSNLVDVAEAVWSEVALIKQDKALQGIRFITIGDQAESVTDSINELIRSGWIGSGLSLIVLFYFLRHWPSTLMVSLAIPICIVMTLGAMYFLGLTLNILTMMGLLLGVGMLVDNAVVVVESIYQYREKYPNDPMRCAIEGTRGVQLAISAGTLTSIIVFAPNIFGERNEISVYLAQIAYTITISLLCSWLVAVSLIPMISARLKTPPAVTAEHGFVPRLTRRYANLLSWSLRHRGWSLLAIAVIIAASMPAFVLMKKDMFPNEASRQLELNFNWRGSYTLEQMSNEVAKVEAFFEPKREAYQLKQVYVYFGEQGFAGVRLTLEDEGYSCNTAASKILMAVGIRDSDKCLRSPEDIQEQIRKDLPKLARAELNFGGGGGPGGNQSKTDQTVQVFIEGDSSEKLQEIGKQLLPLFSGLKELRDVRLDVGDVNSEVRVTVDREKAAAYGFSTREVAQYIGIALRGTPLREFRNGDEQIPVWARFEGAENFRIKDMSSLTIRRADGTSVPLLSMVDVRIEQAASQIGRSNRQTALTITANLAPDVEVDKARAAIQELTNKIDLEPGYSVGFGSDFDFGEDAMNQMMLNTMLAFLLIFIIMAALFESLVQPLAILSGVLFSILGVGWLFWLTGTTFSIMAFIGILVLMGVVVNNGIVMLEHINTHRRHGVHRTEALVIGSKERLRPILMTMGTACLGMVPLCFGSSGIGGDGPPYYPMARAIVGGLIFSTVVSLLFLPTVYAWFDDMSLWLSRQARAIKNKVRTTLQPAGN